MIDLGDIRAIARRLHARDVEVAELSEHGCSVMLRIARGDAAASPTLSANEKPHRVVRAERLGVLRLSHPEQLPQPVRTGDEVDSGQTLALLELDGETGTVRATARGVAAAVLAGDGERIDYGRALFELRISDDAPMTQTSQLIADLIDLIAGERLAEVTVRDAERTIRVLKHGDPTRVDQTHASDDAPHAATETARGSDIENVIVAPMTGTFYRSSLAGGAPLASEGSVVDAGAPLAVIEAMKMFNDVLCERAGKVKRWLCEDGQAVEQGQPLCIMQPDEA